MTLLIKHFAHVTDPEFIALEQRLELLVRAVELCGHIPAFTGQSALEALVAEYDEPDKVFPTADNFIKHDICHFLGDAFFGLSWSEYIAEHLEYAIFQQGRYVDTPTIRPAELSQRANVIKALFETCFDASLRSMPAGFLLRLPVAAYGLAPSHRNFKTRYSLMDVQERTRLLQTFQALCKGEGIDIHIRKAALAEANPTLDNLIAGMNNPSGSLKPLQPDLSALLLEKL